MESRSETCLTAANYTIWQLIKTYWKSSSRVPAYLFIAVIMAMTMTLVGLDVVFNYWYNYFYDALQAYNRNETIKLLVIFFVIAAFYIVIAVYRYYISQLFGLRWRRWLTEQFISRWLQKRTYYLLENFDEKTDNPDQRIQEDIAALVSNSIDLSMGLVSAVTTFLAFIYVLWKLSGVFVLPLGPLGTYHIPGYLVWVGILYAFIGSILTVKLGRPLVALNFEQQRREATFRYAAVDLRTHAENVALYRGEHHQRNILQRLFDGVLENWYFIILRQKILLWFTAGYNQLSVMLPLLVALPNYFDKVFLLGGLIQSLQAFGKVQDSLSYLVNSYTQIAQWQAIGQRLTTFVNHMNEAEHKADMQNKFHINKHETNSIVSKNVSVSTPRNETLLQNINEEFKHGASYLIKGISGIGKSTFVRTLSGIWPYASGTATFPKNKLVMYVPQRPYMPIGTLMEAIMFPDKKHPELEKQVPDILVKCNLEHLIPRLTESAAWSEQLSPGEQQRVAFARVLLHKPDWVFLDESTSMLDVANEKRVYHLLKSELPHCSIISVGHRPTLDEYHEHIIDMAKYSAQPAMAT
ncbi:MAG TPA: ABC transporter ATP-binding protein/permease [Gammaproteobacteria bacterium]|jgi:putative ATP-binding cassette transporter|nr:ABC transporter ATP-binding protein/permease [Gammaproteobacteria bacterium]